MRYFLLIVVLTGLNACKKKELYFTLSSFVYESAQKSPLTDARVTLKQVNVDGSLKSGYLADITVPPSGKIQISFKREKALKYILNIEKENYFTYTEEINFSDFSAEKPLVKDFEVFSKSWIKFHLKNDFPANASDVFTLIFLNPPKNCDDCCEKDKYYFNGIIDSTFYCLFQGGKTYDFNYIVSSPFQQADFSLTTVPFDTVEFYKSY